MGFRSIFIVLLSILLTGCTVSKEEEKISPVQMNNHPSPKVVLIVVDSLMDEPLQKAIQEKKAPALAFFLKHGSYQKNLVSSYPTMSVTIDSSLLTGTYPDQHKVPGLVWFDEEEKRIVNYGNGYREMMKTGLTQYAEDALYQFNNEDLSPHVETIHEALDKKGKQTASINAILYRGNYEHTLTIPKVLAKTTAIPDAYQTKGPKMLSAGAFLRQDDTNNHIIKRLGFNDAFTAQEFTYLLKENKLPDFTMMYFPANDAVVHKNGPQETKGIEKADRELQKILNSYPSWEDALDHMVWIIIGDSSQSPIKKDKDKALIDLPKALSSYKQLKINEPVRPNDDLVISANERMAYIYKISKDVSLQKIEKKLLQDQRIAWIAGKVNDTVYVKSGTQVGSLQFKPGGKLIDMYQQTWSLKGNPGILDLAIQNHQLTYGDYPDALARLYGAAHSQKGEFLILDAKPGYEFLGESSPDHAGGAAHGSLHKDDSLTPIIVTGTKKSIEPMRIVDLKDWIEEVLK